MRGFKYLLLWSAALQLLVAAMAFDQGDFWKTRAALYTALVLLSVSFIPLLFTRRHRQFSVVQKAATHEAGIEGGQLRGWKLQVACLVLATGIAVFGLIDVSPERYVVGAIFYFVPILLAICMAISVASWTYSYDDKTITVRDRLFRVRTNNWADLGSLDEINTILAWKLTFQDGTKMFVPIHAEGVDRFISYVSGRLNNA